MPFPSGEQLRLRAVQSTDQERARVMRALKSLTPIELNVMIGEFIEARNVECTTGNILYAFAFDLALTVLAPCYLDVMEKEISNGQFESHASHDPLDL